MANKSLREHVRDRIRSMERRLEYIDKDGLPTANERVTDIRIAISGAQFGEGTLDGETVDVDTLAELLAKNKRAIEKMREEEESIPSEIDDLYSILKNAGKDELLRRSLKMGARKGWGKWSLHIGRDDEFLSSIGSKEKGRRKFKAQLPGSKETVYLTSKQAKIFESRKRSGFLALLIQNGYPPGIIYSVTGVSKGQQERFMQEVEEAFNRDVEDLDLDFLIKGSNVQRA